MEIQGTYTIMVVDDSSTNNLLLEDILHEEGYAVVLATSGEEALDKLNQELPDLILLDIMMPQMSGYKVLNHIMSNSHTQHIPVIMVTAKVDQADVKKAFKNGSVDYIKKPFDVEDLLVRISVALMSKNRFDQLQQLADNTNKHNYLAIHEILFSLSTVCEDIDVLLGDKAAKSLAKPQKHSTERLACMTLDAMERVSSMMRMTIANKASIEVRKMPENISMLLANTCYHHNMPRTISINKTLSAQMVVSLDRVLFMLVIKDILMYIQNYITDEGNIEIKSSIYNDAQGILITVNSKNNKDNTHIQPDTGSYFDLTEQICIAHGFKYNYTLKDNVHEWHIVF